MTLSNNDKRTLVQHRMERAYATVREARVLFEGSMFQGAVNRIYYAMF